MHVAQSARGEKKEKKFCNKRSIWFRKEEVIKRLARRACRPPPLVSQHFLSLFYFCSKAPLWLLRLLFFLSERKHGLNVPRWIGLCPESLRCEHQSAKVFTVMSASSWQALDPRTQPHVIRTRPYDLLHYPVITHAASWRTRHGINNPRAQLWGEISLKSKSSQNVLQSWLPVPFLPPAPSLEDRMNEG